MTAPMLPMALAGALAVVLAGCQAPARIDRIPAGDEAIGFFGASRERLDFDSLPVIRFEPSSWRVSEPDVSRLGEVAAALAAGRRVLVVGVGDDGVPSEHGRQQALARALSVRSALALRGADPVRILVTGVAAEETAGLTGREETGPRVECAVIR